MSENLTHGAAKRHILNMAVPAGIGLFCNTIFNITDTFYAGWIGTKAQAALAFAFPLFFILLSACVGILQAAASQIAAAVGAGDRPRARRLAGQGIVLALLAAAAVWALLLPSTGSMLALLGAESAAADMGEQYIRGIFWGAPAFLCAFALNGALHAVGNTRAFRDSMIAATGLNLILDPIFMFGWFGLPAMGIAGIAWATVLSQAGCAAYMLYALSRTSLADGWKSRFLLPDRSLLPGLAAHATAPFGRMLCINAGFFIITGLLSMFGSAAVAGYGIALRLEQLFLLAAIGLEAGMLSYTSQNFAARRPARVGAAYAICMRLGVKLMAFAAAVMVVGGGFLVALFNDAPAVVEEGRRYLLLAAVSGPLYVIIIVAGAVFLADSRHKVILVMNVLRLAVGPAVMAWILIGEFSMKSGGIWISVFLCNAAAALFAHVCCRRIIRRRQGQLRLDRNDG